MGLLRARGPQPVECFFCLSKAVLGPHPGPFPNAKGAPANWLCPACECWNVRDRRGEMVSSLPAMRDRGMNGRSYEKRASQPATHLPPSRSTAFCRDCLTNQTLVVNMLANYLPDESDPTFPDLLARLPAHRASLYARYPPVCASCQPAVDEALKRADQRAQAEALGNALRRGKESLQRGASGPSRAEALVAQTRKVLFCAGAVAYYASQVLYAVDPDSTRRVVNQTIAGEVSAGQALVAFQAAACFALAAWDPLWLSQWRGTPPPPRDKSIALNITRIVQLVGRLVGALWLLVWAQTNHPPRWFPSPSWGAAVDVLMLGSFVWMLHQYSSERPVALQLVRPVSQPATPSALGPDVHFDSLSALSLSGAPPPQQAHARPTPPPQPVFGKPSLGLTPPPQDYSEPMDWEPTAAASAEPANDWDSFGVGQQSMFPRTSEETGLEPLLAMWGLGSDASYAAPSGGAGGDVQMAPADGLARLRARLAVVQQGLALCRAASAVLAPSPPVRIAYLCAEALVSAARALLADARWPAAVSGADAVLRVAAALAVVRGVQLPLAASVQTLTAVEGVCWALLTLCVRVMTT